MKKDKKNKILDETVLRMAREARPMAPYLALGAALDVLAVLCAVAAPEILGDLVQRLYDYALGDRAAPIRDTLIGPLGLLMAVYALSALLSWGNVQLMNRTMTLHFTCGLRVKISEKIKRLPVKFVDQTPVGDILNRMSDDVGEMGGYIHQIFDAMVKGFFQIAMIAVAMFLENWVLACFVILLTPASLWLSARVSALSERHWVAYAKTRGEMTEVVEESFSNYPTAKAYNLEDYTARKHAEVNERLRHADVRASFLTAIVPPVIAFSNSLAYILINLVGGWLIVRQGVSVGAVVTIVLYARQFATPLEQIASSMAQLNQVKACAKRVFTLLDMAEEENPAAALDGPPKGNVEFSHVDFAYQPEEPLIQDLNITVHPGQKVAIVGPTGAGKTTIVNLLMRFYDPVRGQILLDGQDIGEKSRDAVRACFGMVLQDTWLFRGTIAENIAYGSPNATREEIQAAARRAYCDHFIRTMPQGYDTVIGDDTTNLSGGQKQLLTIARALLANRPLLILDEATSNVDTRTEILIQRAMDELMAFRTCFVIAHRLSTIVDSDWILVLNHGQIVEQGTHRELMAQQGFYHSLYTSQYAGVG